MTGATKIRVGVLGFGAIGGRVAAALHAGEIAGAVLTGVITRSTPVPDGMPNLTLDQALTECDLIIECAGIPAVQQHALQILQAGCDLLLVSIGALADGALACESLAAELPGRLLLATGAIGGLDIIAAAASAGGITSARLTTTKAPKALVQNSMTPAERESLLNAREPVTVFAGGVSEAVTRFPASLNVAMALGIASGCLHETQVHLIADPTATQTKHEILASGPAGSYSFVISNTVSKTNPATSAVVAESLLYAVAKLASPAGKFV